MEKPYGIILGRGEAYLKMKKKKMEGYEGAFTPICLFSPSISVFLSFHGCNSFSVMF